MDILCKFLMPAMHPCSYALNPCRRSGFQFSLRKCDAVIIKKSSFGALKSRIPFVGIRAAATVEAPDVRVDSNVDMTVDILACPICYKPLIRKGPSGLTMSSLSRSGFQCENCKKAYSSRDVYLDLTITSSSTEYDEYNPRRTEVFRSPLVSFIYERGWRQSFAIRGFPGPDEEFKMAQNYLEPAAGGLLMDASCGSGLFSRRFAKCGLYSGVVALDFSENMLRQCYEFIKQDKSLSTVNLALVRADISRLPFTTGSVDAVHAGSRNQSCSETWWCVCGNNLRFIWDPRFGYRKAIPSGRTTNSPQFFDGKRVERSLQGLWACRLFIHKATGIHNDICPKARVTPSIVADLQ